MTVRILIGDVREKLAELADESVHCVVTSPPYFGLRDYGVAGQIGLEATPAEFIAVMVDVFREVRRVLRRDGVLWLNLGDSYASGGGGGPTTKPGSRVPTAWTTRAQLERARPSGDIKPKDLIGMPWRVALALQADGWWLRQALPWVKRNPMPESAKDRPTTAVEYVFMLTKSARCFYDYEAVKRTASQSTHARLAQDVEAQIGSARANGGAKTNGNMKAVSGRASWKGSTFDGPRDLAVRPDTGRKRGKQAASAEAMDRGRAQRVAGFNDRWDEKERKRAEAGSGIKNNDSMDAALAVMPETRAFRNSDLFFDSLPAALGAITDDDGEIIALDVVTAGFKEAHFATFPPKLIEPLIKAGCPAGGIVLDPFLGSGTTAMVADRLGRDCIGIELSPEYAAMAERRIKGDSPLFAEVG